MRCQSHVERPIRGYEMQELHYSMNITWSDKDNVYVVSFPQWKNSVGVPITTGKTFDEAVQNGRDLFELLTEASENDYIPAPAKTLVA